MKMKLYVDDSGKCFDEIIIGNSLGTRGYLMVQLNENLDDGTPAIKARTKINTFEIRALITHLKKLIGDE